MGKGRFHMIIDPSVTPPADITRPPRELVDGLAQIGTAAISGELSRFGIRDPQLTGLTPMAYGQCMAGPALTLQFLPKREDLAPGEEYEEPEKQIHRHVLYLVQEGDVVVVDARGDMHSGIFGEMMMTYFKGRKGAGLVVDGCLRDTPKIAGLGVNIWSRGRTPNFHTQTGLMPYAVNVPVACGGTTVIPGDIVVADDDGAVVVPIALAEQILDMGNKHADWEDFARLRLSQGADLRKYYPISKEVEAEYRAWREKNPL